MKKAVFVILAAVMGLSLLAAPVYADNFSEACNGTFADESTRALAGCDDSENVGYGNIAQNLVNIVISVLGIVAVAVILMAGQRYISSAGDPNKAKSAQQMLIYGVVGFAVVLLSWTIITFIINMLNTAQG